MEKPRAGHVALQGGNPPAGIYGGLCLIRPCGVTFPEGEGKGGKEVPMPKIYFHVDVNSAFFVLVGAQGAARRSTVDLRTIPAVVAAMSQAPRRCAGKKHPGEKIRHPDGGEPLCRPRKCPG